MKTPSFGPAQLAVLGLAAIALAACGSPDAQTPASGGAPMSSLEPIDAVPLPLDDNPMAPVRVSQPIAKTDKKAEDSEAVVAETPLDPTATPVASIEPAAPPRIVVAPRPATAPAAPKPVSRPSPAPDPAEPERPVLNF